MFCFLVSVHEMSRHNIGSKQHSISSSIVLLYKECLYVFDMYVGEVEID